MLDHIGGVKTQTPLVRKTSEIFNLTATNAILVKLTTIMYLNESVN